MSREGAEALTEDNFKQAAPELKEMLNFLVPDRAVSRALVKGTSLTFQPLSPLSLLCLGRNP
jgi:hypothetical protein